MINYSREDALRIINSLDLDSDSYRYYCDNIKKANSKDITTLVTDAMDCERTNIENKVKAGNKMTTNEQLQEQVNAPFYEKQLKERGFTPEEIEILVKDYKMFQPNEEEYDIIPAELAENIKTVALDELQKYHDYLEKEDIKEFGAATFTRFGKLAEMVRKLFTANEDLQEVWARAYFADTLDSAKQELHKKGKALTHYLAVADYFSKHGCSVTSHDGYYIIEEGLKEAVVHIPTLSTEEFLKWHDDYGFRERGFDEKIAKIYDIFNHNGCDEEEDVDVCYEKLPQADKDLITEIIKSQDEDLIEDTLPHINADITDDVVRKFAGRGAIDVFFHPDRYEDFYDNEDEAYADTDFIADVLDRYDLIINEISNTGASEETIFIITGKNDDIEKALKELDPFIIEEIKD